MKGKQRARKRPPLPRVRRPRARWLVPALAGLAVLVAGALAWLLFFSSLLALRTVEVQGVSVLTAEEVLHQAAAPVGQPLARVSERTVAERVAELPAVEQVTVRRRLPDRLDILVAERTPVFGVGTEAPLLLVDGAGAHFRGPAGEGLLKGEGPLDDPALLAGAAAVVTALSDELRDDAVLITFPSREAITVHLDDGLEVFFGSAEQADLKAEVALALIRGTNATQIDVSAPTRPSTR